MEGLEGKQRILYYYINKQQACGRKAVRVDETSGRVDETTEIMSGGARAEKAGSHKAGRSV